MIIEKQKIGRLVEFVDYNHTYKTWEELKKYLKGKNIPFTEYKKVGTDGEDYGLEIIVDASDIYNILQEVWDDLKLVGNPMQLDYIIFYNED